MTFFPTNFLHFTHTKHDDMNQASNLVVVVEERNPFPNLLDRLLQLPQKTGAPNCISFHCRSFQQPQLQKPKIKDTTCAILLRLPLNGPTDADVPLSNSPRHRVSKGSRIISPFCWSSSLSLLSSSSSSSSSKRKERGRIPRKDRHRT